MKLEYENVTKKFDNVSPIVGFDLTINGGQIYAVVGPSGVGKTTLINLAAGFLTPDTGVVKFGGHRISGPSSDRVVVFQNSSLFPWLTVAENVGVGLRKSNEEESERIARLLSQVGLSDASNRYPRDLSGGMRRRTELARAFAAEPRLLLADEPFSANDEVTTYQLYRLLFEEWLESEMSVVFATHDIEEAIFLASRVIVIAGRPASLVGVEDIPYEYPRDVELFEDRRFQQIRRRVFSWLQSPVESFS